LSDAEAILRWLLVLSVISLALAPVAWWLGLGLNAAANGLLKPLSIAILTAPVWWFGAVFNLPFSRLSLVIVTIAGGCLAWSAWLYAKRRIPWRSLVAFEALWMSLFAGYALFRSYNPHIANTEKPMEIALLSSITRSEATPAPDPWLAGEAINYYYFGFQMIASIVKLSGVPPPIAFNLALASLFASVGTAAAAIGYRFAISADLGRISTLFAAGIGLFFVLIAGNMEAAWRLIRNPRETIEAGWWYEGVGWQASRVIVDYGVHGIPGPRGTINEFPAFSFVLGDLHPHVLTYPLLISILALCVGMILRPETLTLPRIASTGALSGLLYVSNSWDAPVGLLAVALAILLVCGWNIRQSGLHLCVALAPAVLIALPFVLTFTPPVGLDEPDLPGFVQAVPLVATLAGTIGVVTWKPSGAGETLLVHGQWVAAATVYIVLAGLADRVLVTRLLRWRLWILAAAGIVALVSVAWSPALLLIGIPMSLTLYIAARSPDPVTRTAGLLFGVGFVLVLIPEYLYIQDAFGDRMNTVFKLYFQAWLFLALASGVTAVLVLRDRRSAASNSGLAALLMIVVLTVPYTPISARDWTDDFSARHGQDGGAFIERLAPDDFLALLWLTRNAAAGSTLVEGPGCSYQSVGGVPMNRFSAFTGVAAIVGWEGHQRQWRRGEDNPIGPRLSQRQELANQWLDGITAESRMTPDPDYIILGYQEMVGSEGCDSLSGRNTANSAERLGESGWTLVFQSGDTRILARE
jgi:YYY domain-containing protein